MAYRDYQRQRQLTLGDLLLENRIILLQGEIHDGNANELVMKLLYLQSENRRKPIHFYIMPHAPGQVPGFLRRNTALALGHGTRHIDSFWVAPAERFTENYVAWGYHDAEAVPVLHVKSGDTVEISDTESPTVPSAWKMQACRRNRWTNRCATSVRSRTCSIRRTARS